MHAGDQDTAEPDDHTAGYHPKRAMKHADDRNGPAISAATADKLSAIDGAPVLRAAEAVADTAVTAAGFGSRIRSKTMGGDRCKILPEVAERFGNLRKGFEGDLC